MLARTIIVFGVLFAWSILTRGQNYSLNGNSIEMGGDCIAITPNQAWQNGSVWYTDQLDLSLPFTLEFNMTFGGQDENGADGMVFVLQTVGPFALGNSGAGMGFAGFNPSFGIEFDTFHNGDLGDLTQDHVAFISDGNNSHNSFTNLDGPVTAIPGGANIEDALEHSIKITWDPVTMQVELFFDCVLRLSDNIDLIDDIFSGNNLVYWGFSGSTGAFMNLQMVCLAQTYSFEINPIEHICQGESVTLNANGNPEGTFSWSPAFGLDLTNAQTVVASPAVSTSYCCTYTDVCGNQVTTCIDVIVEQVPVISAGPDAEYCAGDGYVLNGQCDQSDALFAWSTPNGNIIAGADALSAMIDEPGIYTLTASSIMAGCSSTDDISIEEIPIPQPIIETPITKCSYESVVLDVGSAWDAVVWFDGSNESTLQAASAGSYDVTVTELGCSQTVTFDVTDVMLPDIELGPARLICQGDTTVLDAGTPVQWNGGGQSTVYEAAGAGVYIATAQQQGCFVTDSVIVEVALPPAVELGRDTSFCEGSIFSISSPLAGVWNDGTSSALYHADNGGLYTIEVRQGPCTVRDSIRLEMIPLPVVSLGDDPVFCQGESFDIEAYMEFAEYYIWSTGDTTKSISVSQNLDLVIEVGNACGSSIDSLYVRFEDCSVFVFLPTAFTPNGDELNDIYRFSATNVDYFELSIYDGWGKQIFQTLDPNSVWLGNVNGGAFYAPNGIYNYRVVFRSLHGNMYERRGYIQVIR